MSEGSFKCKCGAPKPDVRRAKDSRTGTSRPTLFEECVGSLTSHTGILNMEGIVRRDLRFIVLIREDLKV